MICVWSRGRATDWGSADAAGDLAGGSPFAVWFVLQSPSVPQLAPQTVGRYHLGEFVNRFQPGSLVMRLPDSGGVLLKGGGEEEGSCACAWCVAFLQASAPCPELAAIVVSLLLQSCRRSPPCCLAPSMA